MDWIKVTPETLPPDGEAVMVTVLYENGNREVETQATLTYREVAKYKRKPKTRTWHYRNGDYDSWEEFGDWVKITHWMPIPAPAEDEEDL